MRFSQTGKPVVDRTLCRNSSDHKHFHLTYPFIDPHKPGQSHRKLVPIVTVFFYSRYYAGKIVLIIYWFTINIFSINVR